MRTVMMTSTETFARLTTLAQRSTPAVEPTGLRALPYPLRYALSDLLTQIAAGERAALACARRVAAEDPRPDARAVALTQVTDEQQHLAFFESALAQLDVPKEPLPQLTAMFDAATTAPDLASLLFGTHLVVETLAHELFRDFARILANVAGAWWMPRKWGAPLQSLATGLAVIEADETRHVAFGALRLRELGKTSGPVQRERLACLAWWWRQQLTTTLFTLPVILPLRRYFQGRVKRTLQLFDARVIEAEVQW